MEIKLVHVPKSTEITVEIRNGDNLPLKIKSVIGNYVPDRVVFKAVEGENYKVTFGNENLKKPEYDLGEFVDLITERDTVTTGKITKIEDKSNLNLEKNYMAYYNIFIGIIVLILIIFMARRITGDKK